MCIWAAASLLLGVKRHQILPAAASDAGFQGFKRISTTVWTIAPLISMPVQTGGTIWAISEAGATPVWESVNVSQRVLSVYFRRLWALSTDCSWGQVKRQQTFPICLPLDWMRIHAHPTLMQTSSILAPPAGWLSGWQRWSRPKQLFDGFPC